MTVLILRAVSGAGKTFFANTLKSLYPAAVIVSADFYFEKDGRYEFDASKLGAAHKSCQEAFDRAIDAKSELIIVSNTNCNIRDAAYYDSEAKAAGYNVIYLVVENRHGGHDNHGVPMNTIRTQENNLRNSLKLS